MESTEHRQQKLKRHVDDIVAKEPSTARRQKGRAALSSSLGKTFRANIAQQIIIRTADDVIWDRSMFPQHKKNGHAQKRRENNKSDDDDKKGRRRRTKSGDDGIDARRCWSSRR